MLRRLSIGDRKHPLDHLFGPNRDQSKIDVFRLRNRSRCFRSRHGTKNSPLKSSQENAARPFEERRKERRPVQQHVNIEHNRKPHGQLKVINITFLVVI